MTLADLKVKIFADGADINTIARLEAGAATILAPHRSDVERNVALVRDVVAGARRSN